MSQNLISFETLVHAFAGVCGSCSAMAIVLPLDTARTRLILDKAREPKSTMATIQDLVHEEGIMTLFRGGLSSIQCVAVSNFIYFYTFHGLKKWFKTEQSAVKDLLFSCCAGALNVIITNPLWVVNSRMKMQGVLDDDWRNYRGKKINGLIRGLFQIGRAEGREGLWGGTAASLILVSNPAIKFTVYEYLKRLNGSTQMSPSKAFVIGALASAVATIITYPIQLVQTKLRQGRTEIEEANFVKLFSYIIRNFGPQYLYRGMEAKLMQSVVTAGFMFLTYEKIAATVFGLVGVKKAV